MSRKILITGGAGFIGSNLVEFLNRKSPDWKITVLDDFSTGLESNLKGLDCELIRGSILDSSLLQKVLRGFGHIVHLAALGSVPRSVSYPRATHDTNATGTLNVLEAARMHSVDHVIVASSSSVYGANPTLPRRELSWSRPLSPYAVSKQTTESYAHAYASSYGMKATAFRFFNVYGPKQRADHPYAAVIPKFVSAALAGERITIHGDGQQTRDFTFVESVCDAIHGTIAQHLCFAHPINLALGTRVTLIDLLGKLEHLLKKSLSVEYTEERIGDVRASQADPTLLRQYFPSLADPGLEKGLVKTIEWFRDNGESSV